MPQIKLDTLLLIGSDPLNTTAQTLTGAVNELEAGIGGGSFTIKRTVTAAAGAELIFPEPTIEGGTITYNYDPRITEDSVILPIANSGSAGVPIKYTTCSVHTNGSDGGYVKVTLAQAVTNTVVGIKVFN